MNVPDPLNSVCEEENYRKLHKEHAMRIRNSIYYKCGDLEQAEDIVQEAYVRLWENCKNVILGKAAGFLYTVAQRLFLNQVRHKKVQLNFFKEAATTRVSEDPYAVLREKEFRQVLEKAIAELPEKQRVVFLMNRIDKISFEETAKTLGISVKAVEKRMHNALATLRKKIKELNCYKF